MPFSAFVFQSKKFLVFLLFAICFLLFASSSYAQTPYAVTDTDDHARVQKILYGFLSATSCILSGIDPINPKGCLTYDPRTQTYAYSSENPNEKVGGLVSFASNSMGQMYNIPVSTGSYVNYVASNFGIAPKAYAQNDGFEQLDGILGVWTVFRNISYLFFVLIFVIIGMGVMLRLKIDPRTVMSIQNQIPRLIVGLILITFSYAIAGFMIDLMWTATYLTINIAGQVELPPPENQMPSPWNKDRTTIDQEEVTNSLLSSPIGFGNTVLGRNEALGLAGFAGSVTGTIGEVTAGLITPMGGSADEECGIDINPFDNRARTLQACVRGVMYGIIDWATRILVYLIVLFAVLIALFRIWWSLIKSFAYIIIYTCIAPVYIAAGLIPGSTVGFGAWIRGLTANLAVYPATVAFFLGAYIFLATFKKTYFQPPLVGNPAATDGFGYIAAFAILMVAPELINMLRDALKAPASKYIAPSIQAGFARGGMLPGAAVRGTWHKLWKHDPYGKAIGPLNTAVSRFFYEGVGGYSKSGGPTGTYGSGRGWARKTAGTVGTWLTGKPGDH